MKRKCLAIKDFIKDGEIDKAKDLIRELCPELLEVTLSASHSFSPRHSAQDSRLQFLLKKQILVEMLRKKTSAGDADALRIALFSTHLHF